MNLRVMLADDHKILREALRSVLEHEDDITVVAEASDGIEALRRAVEDSPDIIVMDIGMPGLDGIEVTRRVLKDCPAIKVVALSTYSDRRIALQMMEAGARGYVVKAAGGEELLRAIRAVASGENYLCPLIAAAMTDAERVREKDRRAKPRTADGSEDRRLGQREREILQLLSDGKGASEIALRLNIAPCTVEVHQSNIMRKLDLHSVAELTTYAILHALPPT